MTRRYWMSFADPRKPQGEQFLGVCIVNADDCTSAVMVTHALGINPGGAVKIMAIDMSFDLGPYMVRLLPPLEARELDARITAELAS